MHFINSRVISQTGKPVITWLPGFLLICKAFLFPTIALDATDQQALIHHATIRSSWYLYVSGKSFLKDSIMQTCKRIG